MVDVTIVEIYPMLYVVVLVGDSLGIGEDVKHTAETPVGSNDCCVWDLYFYPLECSCNAIVSGECFLHLCCGK